jgi:eukaryotic-like serine/threonine-protein kinase
MNAERWQQIEELFHAALACEPGLRPAFLASRCGADKVLRSEVESLLSSHESADDFIETPAGDVAAELLGAQAALEAGQQLENYRIVRPIGSGGMGEVYLAEDLRLKRKVALKLLPPHFTVNPDRVRRFEREARAASALNHPNIVTIYEIKQSGSTHFIATEFVDGKTLRQMMNEKPLKLSEILNVAIQVADALSGAHAAGIVHRDIKPENIMIHRQGYVKVLDFGLAKLNEQPGLESDPDRTTLLQSNPGLVMGTVQYMAPEQARGKKVDARADIWSLGVVLFELLAGRVPFEGETPSHVMVALMENELPSVSNYVNASPELERIVTKALRKQAKERYQSAKDLAKDLKEIKQQLQVEEHLRRFAEPASSGAAPSSPQQTLTRATVSSVAQGTQSLPHVSSAEYLIREVSRHKVGVTIAAVLLVTVTVGGYFYLAKKPSTVHSIAVLPFNNAGNNPDLEYLSDGLSESLTNNLSPVPGLTVISRYSSFKYKGKEINPADVTKSLGVDVFITGRIAKLDDNYLINVELVDARGTQIWGKQYNRKSSDVLMVLAESSRDITSELRLRLTKAEEQQLTNARTTNPQAYDLFLKGRSLWTKGGHDNKMKAVEYYQQAIAVDPAYAPAYVELSGSYSALITTNELDQKEFAPKGEAAARKALELDDNLAEAHLAVANISIDKWDWPTTERELKRAVELNPNLVGAHRAYGWYFRIHGRLEEAAAEFKRASELDPLATSPLQARVGMLGMFRQNEQALEGQKKLVQDDPGNPRLQENLGMFYARLGQNREAIAALQESVRLGNKSPDVDIQLGWCYAKLGEPEKTREILNRFKSGKEYASPFGLAVLYLALDEVDQAFAALEEAYAMHDQQLIYLRGEWTLDNWHDDPRYQSLLQRIGL